MEIWIAVAAVVMAVVAMGYARSINRRLGERQTELNGSIIALESQFERFQHPRLPELTHCISETRQNKTDLGKLRAEHDALKAHVADSLREHRNDVEAVRERLDRHAELFGTQSSRLSLETEASDGLKNQLDQLEKSISILKVGLKEKADRAEAVKWESNGWQRLEKLVRDNDTALKNLAMADTELRSKDGTLEGRDRDLANAYRELRDAIHEDIDGFKRELEVEVAKRAETNTKMNGRITGVSNAIKGMKERLDAHALVIDELIEE